MLRVNSTLISLENIAERKSPFLAPDKQHFDFSTILDNFRLHVHNRKNSASSDTVLLDQQMVENLIALKQKSFELLQNYKNINAAPKLKTFSSLDEFVSFIVAQQEVLNLELWKLEAINNYLEQLKMSEEPLQSIHDSFGI